MSAELAPPEASLLLPVTVFSGGLHMVAVCVSVLVTYSFTDAIHTRLGLTHVTSFSLTPLCKGSVCRQSPVLRYWGLGLQYMNVGPQFNS